MKTRARWVRRGIALAGAAVCIAVCTEGQAQPQGSASSRQPQFRIAENESPRPVNRAFFAYNYFQFTVEGGGIFGQSSFSVDPGAFVPVRETIGFEKTFIGGSAEVNILPLLGGSPRLPVQAPGTVVGPGLVIGIDGRDYLGDGAQRSIDVFPIRGVVRHDANWSITGYVGFPLTIVQPTFFPGIDTFTVTPVVGLTYQEDTISSFQFFQLGNFRNENVFEQSFGRTGVTIGVNFDAARGNFLFGLKTGVTLLPETDVSGLSSSGNIGQANIDGQVNLFVGLRAGYRLLYGPF